MGEKALKKRSTRSSAPHHINKGSNTIVVNGSSSTAGHQMNEVDKPKKESGSGWMLVICFFGIFVSYFIYGLLQETISKRDFDGEKFSYFMFLVWFQCIVNACVAKLVSMYKGQQVSLKPYSLFGATSLSYVSAMVASNSSLAFINYPTQVLGKSVKPIPILILGVLLGTRSYPLTKYLCVLLIVFGVGVFLYKDHTPGKNSSSDDYFKLFDIIGLGEVLVGVSLILDGVTGVLQDKLLGRETSAIQMMYAMNVYAPLYLTIGLVVSGEGFTAVEFLTRHPSVILNIISFSVASALGQIFIFTTISIFGPLTCSIITTTRKFFTILGSVILFGNSLLFRQWIGVVFVFIGLFFDVYFEKRKKKVATDAPPQNA